MKSEILVASTLPHWVTPLRARPGLGADEAEGMFWDEQQHCEESDWRTGKSQFFMNGYSCLYQEKPGEQP